MPRTESTTSLDAALDARVEQLVEAKLAKLGLIHSAARFTSDSLPPDCPSSRAFAIVCRSGRVAGAEKIGRQWQCTREAWIAARRKPKKTALRLVPKRDDDEDLVDAAIEGLRGRATR